MVRALGLCSGGLDSILSAIVLRLSGIYVEWIAFESPFFSSIEARRAAENNNIPLRVINITQEFLEMMENPKCKFGKNMNPCMDCHSLMFRIAGVSMFDEGFDFMFSGEVLGQRPMSQNKTSLRYVEKNSGYAGYILRPLSAKKLPPTIPEKKGIIDRVYLLDISGRSRKRQIELANKFGIKEYPSPAGGCLLTDRNFCLKLKDLFLYEKFYSERNLKLLKFGRHMRLNNKIKIIIGRNMNENDHIKKCVYSKSDVLIESIGIPGPTVLIPDLDVVEESLIKFVASICVGYSKAYKNSLVEVKVMYRDKEERFKVNGVNPIDCKHFLI